MISIPIFIDANVFIAYANTDDVHHKSAQKVMREAVAGKYGAPFTTDYILDECLTVTLVKTKSLEKAVTLGKFMMDSEIKLVKLDERLLEEAWKIFAGSNSLQMSFTDCTNLAFMRVFRIDKIASFDRAFEKVKGIEVVA